MVMRLGIIVLLVSACVSAAGASPSGAQSITRGPGRWWRSEQYRQELKLTADQSAQIEQIVKSSAERLRPQKDELDKAQNVFSVLMAKNDADEGEIMRAIDRVETARYTMSKERTMMLVRIHRVLSPDQRKMLDAVHRRDDDRKICSIWADWSGVSLSSCLYCSDRHQRPGPLEIDWAPLGEAAAALTQADTSKTVIPSLMTNPEK